MQAAQQKAVDIGAGYDLRAPATASDEVVGNLKQIQKEMVRHGLRCGVRFHLTGCRVVHRRSADAR